MNSKNADPGGISQDRGLYHEEGVPRALVGGAVAALLGGGLWAAIVLLAHLEIGWVAWGVGLLVGLVMARLTPVRGQAIAVLAALLAALGLVVGKGLILAMGTRPGLVAEIKADSAWLAQAALHDLRTRSALPGDLQEKLQRLSFTDTLPDALWAEMLAASAAHAASLDDTAADRVASDYAEVLLGDASFIGLVRSQLSLWDVLWFGLAIATAWRIMARHPEPKAGTAEA
jgi:xanthosine utilization system XapX-like protein